MPEPTTRETLDYIARTASDASIFTMICTWKNMLSPRLIQIFEFRALQVAETVKEWFGWQGTPEELYTQLDALVEALINPVIEDPA